LTKGGTEGTRSVGDVKNPPRGGSRQDPPKRERLGEGLYQRQDEWGGVEGGGVRGHGTGGVGLGGGGGECGGGE